MNKKTTFYLFFVTLLALLLNLILVLSLLNMSYILNFIKLDLDVFITFVVLVVIPGAFISFVFFEMLACLVFGVILIKQPTTYLEKWLFTSVEGQSRQLGIIMPQVVFFMRQVSMLLQPDEEIRRH